MESASSENCCPAYNVRMHRVHQSINRKFRQWLIAHCMQARPMYTHLQQSCFDTTIIQQHDTVTCTDERQHELSLLRTCTGLQKSLSIKLCAQLSDQNCQSVVHCQQARISATVHVGECALFQRTGTRQSGQASCIRSHLSTQWMWYTWRHLGSSLTLWPLPKSSRQMEQLLTCMVHISEHD